MDFEFDGLRAILGNSAVAVPLVDASAVEDPTPADVVTDVAADVVADVVDVQPAAATYQAEEPSEPTHDLELQSNPPGLADLPDLTDLDRGLFQGDSQTTAGASDGHSPVAAVDDSVSFDSLGVGLDDPNVTSRTLTSAASNAPLMNDPESLEVDDGVFAGVAPAPTPTRDRTKSNGSARNGHATTSERRISGWAAVAVMVFGLMLGGTAAIAVFHASVSDVLVSWGSVSSRSAQSRTR